MAPRIGPEPQRPPRTAMEKFLQAIPFGLGVRNKPRHFLEMWKTLWDNRRAPGYAWSILKHGVCDGCSLGPRGLQDDVIKGTHLCTTRLRLLKLNTAGPMDFGLLGNVDDLKGMSGEALQALGRIPVPLVRYPGMNGFSRIEWEEAIDILAERLKKSDPKRTAWFATSRGITNEGYYAFQKAARLLGSPHVDYCARLCHAPSSIGLGDVFGVGAPTCSLKDLIGTDLLVLWGTNLANNQPVATKYLHYAKKEGTRIAVVNPYREPGLERYWVPSVPGSAMFGTRLMDDFYPVRVGGDIAFMNGVLKALHARGGFDKGWLDKHATGVDDLVAKVTSWNWTALEQASGLPRAEMERFADIYAKARTAVFVYSMGLTQRTYGVDNVRSIATLAAVRGMVGREKCGVMPIRGHSGVQGGSEVGVAPDKFPGGLPVNEENAAKLSALWGAKVPAEKGMAAVQMIESARRGGIDVLYSMGGNFLETLPDRAFAEEALKRIPVRVHQDIVLNSSMLLPAGEMVMLLPSMTRYELPGGGTSTSTERRIRFSPEIPGPRILEAKPEWQIPVLIAMQADLARQRAFPWKDTADIRREIEKVVPLYKGIADLKEEGQSVQWGGERLFEGGVFDKMPGGRCRLMPKDPPSIVVPPGKFHVTTRRGKQFNSMTQGERDPLTGLGRDAVLMNPEDASGLGLKNGDAVEVVSETGRLTGVAALVPVRRGTVQLYWPEANVLIPRRLDPESGEPEYAVFAELKKA
ncbi:MAG TPA: FdhF/YdeP family oxidoreductase [Planctomycetota bacterium]